MKTNITLKIFASVLTVMLFSVSAYTQIVELNKSINKSFKIIPECNVQITNKYGNVHIVPTESDSIRFEIEITVADKLREKATRLLNGIDVKFDSSPYYIITKTVFSDNNEGVWSNLSDIANTLINGNSKVEINWVVYLPEKNELKIENKYGSIYTTNHTGKLTIELSNGDFQANNLLGETKLKLAFGNAHINSLVNANLDLTYMDFDLKKANKLDLLSKSSQIRIPLVKEMYLNSRRDNVIIDTIQTVKGESYFSTLKFRSTIKNVILNSKYGNLSFDELAIDLTYLSISSSYTDVFITINKDFSGKVDLTYRKAILALPEIMNAFPKVVSNQETQEFKSNGVIGSEKPDATEFKLNINQGRLSIGVK